MPKYLAIREWDKYQHYTDRCPPWVKLHRSILTSPTWVSCDDASRVLAIALIVLASQSANRILADADYLKRVAYLNKTPDWSKLVKIGFIEIIDETDNASKPDLNDSVNSHVESSATIETDQIRSDQNNVQFPIFWRQYPRKQSRGHAEKAFSKALTRASFEEILAGLRRYQFADDPKFIPMAATWLNGDRWTDEDQPMTADTGYRPMASGAGG